MKKIVTTLLFVFIFSLVLSPVLAEEKKTTEAITNIREKVQTALEREKEKNSTKPANLENQKSQNVIRVRAAIGARWNAYDKLVRLSGQLLDKLQIRIGMAKASGQNTTESENAMVDARAKLADAKTQLDGLKSLVGTATNKNTFMDAQKKFQAIHKDLNIVRQDASKIIRNLKSFNSSKTSTSSATTSARER